MKLSHDLGRVRIFRHGECAFERAEEALEPMEFSLLFFLLGFALPRNVKDAVFDRDFYVILSHLGQVGLEQILVVIFDDIHQGRPIGHLEPVAVLGQTKRESRETAKKCLEAVLKFLHLPQRVPYSECFHNFFLSVQDWWPGLQIALTINCDSLFKFCDPRPSADSPAQKMPLFSQKLHGAAHPESSL